MEIKTTLLKPYTDKAKADFIVTNNHNQGYEIRETETALEAWGHTEEEISQQKELEQAEIEHQENEKALNDLMGRMVTADLAGDEEWKADLRAEYAELMGEDEEPTEEIEE